MTIVNVTRQTQLAQQVIVANTPLERMQGLLNRESFLPQEALVITQCSSIHMFFMKFAIDVVFVDKHNQVVGLCPHIKPFEVSPIFWKSACAIELPAGTIKATGTQVGDQLEFNK